MAVQLMPLRCVCPHLSGFGLERLDFGKVARKVLGGEGIVLEVAGEELVVGGHVDESVAREVEEYHLLLAGLLATLGLTDGGGDGMA